MRFRKPSPCLGSAECLVVLSRLIHVHTLASFFRAAGVFCDQAVRTYMLGMQRSLRGGVYVKGRIWLALILERNVRHRQDAKRSLICPVMDTITGQICPP